MFNKIQNAKRNCGVYHEYVILHLRWKEMKKRNCSSSQFEIWTNDSNDKMIKSQNYYERWQTNWNYTLHSNQLPHLIFYYYISTDVVERYCYRSRNQYFMVKKLRNYSTIATITKFKLSSKAIYLGGNPKKWKLYRLLRYSTWTASPKRAKFLLFSFRFVSLHLDWRSRREVLLPLTESIFHGQETTQLLNNC